MSNLPEYVGVQPPGEAKSVALVKKITEKTVQGRISWKKTSTGAVASIPSGLQFSFVGSSSPFGLLVRGVGETWSLFAVRDQAGNEILKVQQPAGISILSGPLEGAALVEAVTALYSAVQGRALTEIDKAINLLDKL